MQKFTRYDIQIEKQEPSTNYGKYSVSPLEKGFGITLGNAIRRIMLSSIPGSSAFAIKIPGVTHEYQAINGVKEDVTQIILNIKNLVLKIDENIFTDDELDALSLEKWPVLRLIKKESGPIYAADIECPAGIEVLNGDLLIATASEKVNFEMEIYATRSRGFKTFQENRDRVNTIGLIAIDSNYSPVIRVAYDVEEIKTAKRGTSDKLTIELTTNGAMNPADVIALASRIMIGHFEPLANISESIKQIEIMKEKEIEEKNSTLAIPIEDLGITMRSYNGLKRSGIQTIQEITSKTRDEITKIRNLGKKSIKEINQKLAERGLKFRDN